MKRPGLQSQQPGRSHFHSSPSPHDFAVKRGGQQGIKVHASSRPSRRAPQQSRHHSEPPPTAMRAALLRALAKWVERHTGNDRIAIPAGNVAADELVRVLRALGLVDRRAP